jgi:hypothetical protein
MNIFPVAIGDVLDAIEDPPPLPDDSPPGKDLQPQIKRVSVDSSSDISAPASSRKHYSQSNRNASTSLRTEYSKSYPKDVMSADSRESGLSSRCGNNQASSPETRTLTRIPQLASPRSKKRRHRGRHRQHSDNTVVTGSLQDDPSPRTAANGSAAPLNTVPPAGSLRRSDPDGFSKSAPCDYWSFMGMVSDPVSWGLESNSTETVPLTSPVTATNQPNTACSCAPPKDQRRLTKGSWYSQALPFFSASLGGDDDVTEVQCTLLMEWYFDVLYARFESRPSSTGCFDFSWFSSVFQVNTWIALWNWVAAPSCAFLSTASCSAYCGPTS